VDVVYVVVVIVGGNWRAVAKRKIRRRRGSGR